jgi:hypothetical protein
MRLLCALVLAALVLQVAGCGESSEATEQEAPASTPQTEETAELRPIAARSGGWRELRRAVGPRAHRLIIPHGQPPEKVTVRRLRPGRGPVLQEDDTFHADYVYFDYETGEAREESEKDSRAAYFYTPGAMVEAWWSGLRDMRVGEQREIIAPSHSVYGLPPRVYLVELTEIERE